VETCTSTAERVKNAMPSESEQRRVFHTLFAVFDSDTTFRSAPRGAIVATRAPHAAN